jgi:hypothetical protein
MSRHRLYFYEIFRGALVRIDANIQARSVTGRALVDDIAGGPSAD